MTRIAISGIGIIAPDAIGLDAFRALLASGRTATRVVDFKPRDFIHPMKMRRMNALSRFGVAAAKLALADAGLDPGRNTGVALGTAFGPVQTSVDYMQEYVEKGAALAPPQLFAESVANAPGSHIAIESDFRGFNVTITQRESSALAAAMYACSQLVKGSVDAALTGGVEEASEMTVSVLERVGALSRLPARPFDRARDGMSIGEGGAVLLLQPRAAKSYAFFSGFGIARDTTASISDWGDDHGAVVTAMRAAIDDAEIAIGDVDAIYASANGSVRGDAVEGRAIETLFGERMPPVVATKGIFGEYAAGGALHLVSAIVAIDEQTLHASTGFESGDFRFTPNRERRDCVLRHVLVNSVSAGGGIVCGVLSREAA
ncbi:MAG TPA: beta-ketoacyl synthase N-terminal-like domain-containing protein [Thermoanaerobaculia bacterium]|nr:beta-ketoacyl synthase N-terminal-like domain-containing protein [Thermoanaerobaculia bacterium]